MSNVMENPPVFHMLLQVQFNRLPLIGKHIDHIQDEFRKYGFPDSSHAVQTEAKINISNTDPAQGINFEQHQIHTWAFLDFEKTTGYMLTENFIVFHTTDYKNFEAVQPKILKGIEIINDIVRIDYIERVGMRFLNAISPNDEAALSEHVRESVLGFDSEELSARGFTKQQSVSESIFNHGTYFCVGRAVIGEVENAPPLMPHDLQPLINTLKLKENFRKMNGRIIILDIDCSEVDRKKIDLEQLDRAVVTLHDNVKSVFASTIKSPKVQ